MTSVTTRLLLGVGFAAGVSAAVAHDLQVEPEASGYRLLHGHHHRVSHRQTRQDAYAPEADEVVHTKALTFALGAGQ